MARDWKTVVFHLVIFITIVNCYPGQYKSVPREPEGPYDAAKDAALLRKAMIHAEPDVVEITKIFVRRNFLERRALVETYENDHQQVLTEQFDKKLTKFHARFFRALITPMKIYYAGVLREALPAFANLTGDGTIIEGMKRDDLRHFGRTIVEIICTSTNVEKMKIRAAYEWIYEERLEDALTRNIHPSVHGSLKSLIVALLKNHRQDDVLNVNEYQVREDLDSLYSAGKVKSVENFIEIFTTRSYNQLVHIFREHVKKYGKTMESAIELEFTGITKLILLEIGDFAKNQAEYFARRLQGALNGRSLEMSTVVRIIVFRSEIDLDEIADAFLGINDRSLIDKLDDRIDCGLLEEEPLVTFVKRFTNY